MILIIKKTLFIFFFTSLHLLFICPIVFCFFFEKFLKTHKMADISAINADISTILCVFLIFFHKPTFLCQICVGYIGKKSIYRRYIADIDQCFSDFSNK